MNVDSTPARPHGAAGNLFSQQRLERLTFRFPDGRDWPFHLQRLRQANYRGFIIGEHGTGKSTLLGELHRRVGQPNTSDRRRHEIAPHRRLWAISEPPAAYCPADSTAALHSLLVDIPRHRTQQHEFGCTRQQQHQWLSGCLSRVKSQSLILVDGLERLSWPARIGWVALISRRFAGLVLTVHRRPWWLRLPTWIQTSPSFELLESLLSELDACDANTRALAHVLFRQHDGNLREVLRSLYDTERR